MSLPPDLGGALGAEIRDARRVGGGSINDAWRVELDGGATAFVKSRADASPADFLVEAAGLRWLHDAGAVAVPEVLGLGEAPSWLALEWVEPGALSAAGAEELGRGLAALHRAGAAAHGSLPPDAPDATLRIGSVGITVAERKRWADLYAEDLVLPLAGRARDGGSLTAEGAAAIESVCRRIGELAGPAEPPARLHGDLWSGNVHAAADGSAWLIDPAAYGGHREVDLAMLRLFGAPSERIFAAYQEAYPLAGGHAERVGLWQLLPLLVHAVLFGGSYGAAAGDAARHYA
jgi:fructosamine-3-kinase